MMMCPVVMRFSLTARIKGNRGETADVSRNLRFQLVFNLHTSNLMSQTSLLDLGGRLWIAVQLLQHC